VMWFHRLPPSAQVPASPARAEKDTDSAVPATPAQLSRLQKLKAEAAPVLESWSRHSPARKSDSPEPAAKAHLPCRPPVETSPASAAPAEAPASVTATAPAVA